MRDCTSGFNFDLGDSPILSHKMLCAASGLGLTVILGEVGRTHHRDIETS